MKIKESSKQVFLYLCKWIPVSLFSGIVLGAVGSGFVKLLHLADHMQRTHFWGIFLMPIIGCLIIFLYNIAHYKDEGSNIVLSTVLAKEDIPFRVAPLIFVSTILSQLAGASAGKEGAALQIGGSIGNGIGKLFHFNDENRRIMVMCGMSAVFSAVFGTPMTAAFFAMEVSSIGLLYHAALLPCVFASCSAWYTARFIGTEETIYIIKEMPDLSALNFGKAALMGLLCGLLAILFCEALHIGGLFLKKWFKNSYICIIVGSLVFIGIILLEGSRDFTGSGLLLISEALQGNAKSYGFILKLFMTVLALKCGFKGGEIVPTLAIGATFGCVVAPLVGLPASLGAALCMIALFCGATNCPLASAFMAYELFGAEGIPFFLVALTVSFVVSGYSSLYNKQVMFYSKYMLHERKQDEGE